MTKLSDEVLANMWRARMLCEGTALEMEQAAWDASPAGELVEALRFALFNEETRRDAGETYVKSVIDIISAALSNLGAPHV